MKVRHKVFASDGPWIVLRESPSYYICEPHVSDGEFVLPKSDYDPVPDDRWEDVTGEVEIREREENKGHFISEAGVFHGMNRLAYLVCGGTYRLHKVSLWDELPQSMREILAVQTYDPRLVEKLKASVSLIVERKVTR